MKKLTIMILMLTLFSITVVEGALTDNNVLYYDFGTTEIDAAILGSPTIENGKVDGTYNFDGSSDYLDVGTTMLKTSDSDFSFSVWTKADTHTGNDYIFTDGQTSGSNCGWRVMNYDNGASIRFDVRGSGSTGSTTSSFAPSTGTWYHVAGTYDSNSDQISLYINGVLNATDTNAFDVGCGQNEFMIGANTDGNDEYWDGNLDEIVITSDVLTSGEISTLYASGNPSERANNIVDNIIYYNDMDTTFDWSGNANFGEMVGGDNIATGKLGSSYNFDGSSDSIDTGISITSGNISAFTWVKTTSTQADSLIDSTQTTTVDGWDLAINRGTNGANVNNQLSVWMNDGASTYFNYTIDEINDGAWHYVGFTFDNSIENLTLWFDGNALKSYTINNPDLTGSNIRLGRRSGYVDSYFTGELDEVALYNRYLSENEISQLYNSGTGYNPYASAGSGTVTLITPTNDSYLNVDSVNFNYDFLNLTGSIDNTSIYINGVLNKTNLSLISSTNQTFSISGFEDGNYNYQIRGFAGGIEASSLIYDFTIDTVQPFITSTGFTNDQKFQGAGFSNIINLTGTINIADNNLYKVNISTQIETYYYNDSITTDQLNITLDEYIANYPPGKYTLNITASDGHTAKKIDNYKYNGGRTQAKKFDFNDPNLFFVEDFVEVEVNEGNIELIKEKDRYKFDWKKNTFSKKPNALTFTVKSDHYIDIPQNTDYAGHVIIPSLNKWVDFEIEGEEKRNEDYIIERISDYEVQITVTKFNRDQAIFRSIGDLNVNTVLFDFYVYNATETFDQIVLNGYSTEYTLDLNYDYEDYDSTLPVAILQINDTNYTATLESNSQYASRFVYEHTIPQGNQDYNLTHVWHVNYSALTNGVDSTLEQNQSINLINVGVCAGNLIYPIAYINYYDETDLSSIAATNAYSLRLVNKGVNYDISGTFVNQSSSSLCTDVDPSYFDVNFNAFGSFTLSKTDYTLRIFDVAEQTPIAFSNSPPYNLSLYMVPFNESTTVTYSIRTSDFGSVDGTLQIYRCELDQSQILVESVPIIGGQSFANIELNTAAYAYRMIIGNNIYTSPTGWSRCHVENSETINIVVNVGDESLQQQLGLRAIECTLEKTGNNTVTLNWGPNSELETPAVEGCIKAYRMTVNGLSEIYNQCFTNPVYSSVVLVPANGNDYTVDAYLKQGNYISECTQQVNFSTNQSEGGFFGFTGLIAAFFMLAALTLLFAGSGENQLIALSAGMVSIFFLQILPVRWNLIISIIAILTMVIAVGRYARK